MEGLTVGGASKLVAIAGYPVAQVRSPTLLSRAFQDRGFDAIQMPLHVHPDDLIAAVEGLKRVGNFAGLVFTVPHKIAALALADRLSPVARAAGSINALRRDSAGIWFGDNVDGISFVRGLRNDGARVEGARVMVVGCGGVGGAICAALAEGGIARLSLHDVDTARCENIVRRMSATYPAIAMEVLDAPRADVEIAVNCTALGMAPNDPLPFDPNELPPHALVAEVVMSPRVTRLLEAASAAGHPVALGENLLNNQIELLTDFFSAAETW